MEFDCALGAPVSSDQRSVGLQNAHGTGAVIISAWKAVRTNRNTGFVIGEPGAGKNGQLFVLQMPVRRHTHTSENDTRLS